MHTPPYIPTLLAALLLACFSLEAQVVSNVPWQADLGNGFYQNPVLHADYSDPDVVRVGDDFYMVASSFEAAPGLPILHSKDLVNWKLIGHALPSLVPAAHYAMPRHGAGVWAPSIRFHKGEFYVYYPDPDFGIYLVKAKHPAGPWSQPVLVEGGKGLIDPCPLWDDDGRAYLVHAYAGSRAGIKSVLVIKQLNQEGTRTLDQGVIVYDGHEKDPTVEGPKLYKRNGFYYILAPAGGVSTGWQLALRSKNIYGPYERKVVMHQGSTNINGPHQGAWINTQMGEDWFLHFQDKDAYGRVVHLQPLKWVNDWPVIGVDKDGDGTGEPMLTYRKPKTTKVYPDVAPATSDEFNNHRLGLQWQWLANPPDADGFLYPGKGVLRLYCRPQIPAVPNLWYSPRVLLQKFPAPTFTATTRLTLHPSDRSGIQRAGLVVMGQEYATIFLQHDGKNASVGIGYGKDADKQVAEEKLVVTLWESSSIYLRLQVSDGGLCLFSYSADGINFQPAGKAFRAVAGRWTGARVGLFAEGSLTTNDTGFADFDWFRVGGNEK